MWNYYYAATLNLPDMVSEEKILSHVGPWAWESSERLPLQCGITPPLPRPPFSSFSPDPFGETQ